MRARFVARSSQIGRELPIRFAATAADVAGLALLPAQTLELVVGSHLRGRWKVYVEVAARARFQICYSYCMRLLV